MVTIGQGRDPLAGGRYLTGQIIDQERARDEHLGVLGIDRAIYCGAYMVNHRREERGQEMSTIREGKNHPMPIQWLIPTLAGEMEIDPGLLVETIKYEPDLIRVVKSYRLGDLTYSQVLDTLGDYF